MGNWRTDVWIRKNNPDGTQDTTQKFNYIGRGKDFTVDRSNSWKTVNGMGSKFVQLQSAGKYTVSGKIGTYLDFNNFYHLIGAFEMYETTQVTYPDGTIGFKHSFSKSNLKKIPSFTMIAKKLNRAVGGENDETIYFERVYFKGIDATWDGSSTAMVKVNYNYTAVRDDTILEDTELKLQEAEALNKEQPVEWGCLSWSEDGNTFYPIATNEKTKISFTTTLGTIGKCGSRTPTDFSEQNTSAVTTESSIYSRDGFWLKRVYSGGLLDGEPADHKYGPKSKYLKPIPYMRISSMDKDTLAESKYQVVVTMENVMVDSLNESWNTSAITDSPKLSATRVKIDVITPDVNFDVYTKREITTPLFITSPENNFVDETGAITVVGTTKAGATINIELDGSDVGTVTVDENGAFQKEIALPEKEGHIIKVFANKGQEAENVKEIKGDSIRDPGLILTTPVDGMDVGNPFALAGTTDSIGTTVEYSLNGDTPTAVSIADGSFSVEGLVPINNSNVLIVKATRIIGGKTKEIVVNFTHTPSP